MVSREIIDGADRSTLVSNIVTLYSYFVNVHGLRMKNPNLNQYTSTIKKLGQKRKMGGALYEASWAGG